MHVKEIFSNYTFIFVINLHDAKHFISNFNIFLSFYSFNRNYVTPQESTSRPHMRRETQPYHLVMPLDSNAYRSSLSMLDHGTDVLQRFQIPCVY